MNRQDLVDALNKVTYNDLHIIAAHTGNNFLYAKVKNNKINGREFVQTYESYIGKDYAALAHGVKMAFGKSSPLYQMFSSYECVEMTNESSMVLRENLIIALRNEVQSVAKALNLTATDSRELLNAYESRIVGYERLIETLTGLESVRTAAQAYQAALKPYRDLDNSLVKKFIAKLSAGGIDRNDIAGKMCDEMAYNFESQTRRDAQTLYRTALEFYTHPEDLVRAFSHALRAAVGEAGPAYIAFQELSSIIV